MFSDFKQCGLRTATRDLIVAALITFDILTAVNVFLWESSFRLV